MLLRHFALKKFTRICRQLLELSADFVKLPLSHNGKKIPLKNSCIPIVTRITTKIQSHTPPFRKISSKFVDDFLSHPVDRQTNTQRVTQRNRVGEGSGWVLEKELLEAVIRRRSSYFGHYTETVACLEKDLVEGTVPGQRRGRTRTSWLDHVKVNVTFQLISWKL